MQSPHEFLLILIFIIHILWAFMMFLKLPHRCLEKERPRRQFTAGLENRKIDLAAVWMSLAAVVQRWTLVFAARSDAERFRLKNKLLSWQLAVFGCGLHFRP